MRIPFAVLHAFLLALLLTLLGGCGDEPDPAVVVAARPLPTVPMYRATAKARYALECLEQGPGQLRGLLIKDVHTRNLELATADLVFFEVEASKLLLEPARIARVTGDPQRYGDAWHNVLRLILGFRLQPVDLVVAWTRPTLELPDRDEFHSLRLEAARVLSLTEGLATADVLLSLYEAYPADREISAMALFRLNKHPAHRERALAIALREGVGSLWQSAPARILGAMPRSEVDPDVTGVLAWWHALTAGSGPRMDTMLPQLKSQPWTQARLGVDPAVPPRVTAPDGTQRLRYGSIASATAYSSGWFSSANSTGPELPAHGLSLTGKLPAGETRCSLAQFGYAGYKAAVRRDLGLEEVDEGLYFAAKHCMLDVDPTGDAEAVLKSRAVLAEPGPWTPARVRRVQRLITSIGSCGAPAVWQLLADVLGNVRPLDVGRPVIEQAYDIMYQRVDDLRTQMAHMLAEGSPGDAGVALHLIRRARDPEYLDLLEARLDASDDEAHRVALWRTLTFIYSGAVGIEPARYVAFVDRYLAHLTEVGETRFSTLASGLLDFSDAGVAAFVRGLQGPQRTLYIRSWPRGRHLVPQAVAEAAIAPLNRGTSPAELNHVLGLAWSSFPAAAGPALEALRRRLPKARRGPVEAALERVLHRAPRHGDA